MQKQRATTRLAESLVVSKLLREGIGKSIRRRGSRKDQRRRLLDVLEIYLRHKQNLAGRLAGFEIDLGLGGIRQRISVLGTQLELA
jgi:hypothetical protein